MQRGGYPTLRVIGRTLSKDAFLRKRLERGRFVWRHTAHGTVSLSAAHLSMLLEGIAWRRVLQTAKVGRNLYWYSS